MTAVSRIRLAVVPEHHRVKVFGWLIFVVRFIPHIGKYSLRKAVIGGSYASSFAVKHLGDNIGKMRLTNIACGKIALS